MFTTRRRPLYVLMISCAIFAACAPATVEPTQSSTPQKTSVLATVGAPTHTFTLTPLVAATSVAATATPKPPKPTHNPEPTVDPKLTQIHTVLSDKIGTEWPDFIQVPPDCARGYSCFTFATGGEQLENVPFPAYPGIEGLVARTAVEAYYLSEGELKKVIIPTSLKLPDGTLCSTGDLTPITEKELFENFKKWPQITLHGKPGTL